VRQFEGAFAARTRARCSDNNWPSSGRGAGVTTRSGGSIYITIFYAQAVVVIDTYSKTLNDNDSACCWIDIFDSFLLSPGAKRGLPRAATLEEFPAFQRKVVAIPAAARSNIFLMRDTFSLRWRRKKFKNARERRHSTTVCCAQRKMRKIECERIHEHASELV
jgi:hypothetical protein